MSFGTSVALFIFHLGDLSIDVSGVLKSPTIIVLLSIVPFVSYLGPSVLPIPRYLYPSFGLGGFQS